MRYWDWIQRSHCCYKNKLGRVQSGEAEKEQEEMVPEKIVIVIVTFFHDFFTAVWIGGLVTLGGTVLPAVKKVLGMGPQTKQLLDAIQKRLSLFVYVSMVGLAVTGLMLGHRSDAYQGLFSFGNTYSTFMSAKHILMLLMVAVALIRSVALGRQGAADPSEEKRKMALLYLNLALGILVLLLSALTSVLASVPPLT